MPRYVVTLSTLFGDQIDVEVTTNYTEIYDIASAARETLAPVNIEIKENS